MAFQEVYAVAQFSKVQRAEDGRTRRWNTKLKRGPGASRTSACGTVARPRRSAAGQASGRSQEEGSKAGEDASEK